MSSGEVDKSKEPKPKPKVTLFPHNDPLCSDTGGVIPMSISGRMIHERERGLGMSDAERAWRKQWLQDQILAPEEPVTPPNYRRERYNIIRRFYRWPLDTLESALHKRMHLEYAKTIRHAIANLGLGLLGTWCLYYYLKYNHGDWTRKKGARMYVSRVAKYPGDPGFSENIETPKPNEFATCGFENSPI